MTITPYSGTLWANRTVGLLGGSFNPAHEGHLHASLQAIKHLQLDAVWWLVSPQNPLKSSKGMAKLESRLKGAEAVAHGHPKIFVTGIEKQLNTRYTVDTIDALKERFPLTRFVWLMGLDNLRQIHLWARWQDIFTAVPVCVIDRLTPGSKIKSCPALERFRPYLADESKSSSLKACAPPAWTILHTPLNKASSTEIRKGKRGN